MSKLFSGGSSSPMAQQVEKATNGILMEPDWSSNMDICDALNQDPGSIHTVVKAIKKRLQSKDPRVQLLALTLLETMMKNCGTNLHAEVAGKDILPEMVKIVKKRPDLKVREKILGLLDVWQEMFGGPTGRLQHYWQAYDDLRRSGVTFPERSSQEGQGTSGPAGFGTPPSMQQPLRDGTPVYHGEPARVPSYNSPAYGSPSAVNRLGQEQVAGHQGGDEIGLAEMANARSSNEVLTEMLNAADPNDRQALRNDVVGDLVEQCRTNQQRVLHMVNSSGDEELLRQGLALNDDLQKVLTRYEDMLQGGGGAGAAAAAPPPPAQPRFARFDAEEEVAEEDDFGQLAHRSAGRGGAPTHPPPRQQQQQWPSQPGGYGSPDTGSTGSPQQPPYSSPTPYEQPPAQYASPWQSTPQQQTPQQQYSQQASPYTPPPPQPPRQPHATLTPSPLRPIMPIPAPPPSVSTRSPQSQQQQQQAPSSALKAPELPAPPQSSQPASQPPLPLPPQQQRSPPLPQVANPFEDDSNPFGGPSFHATPLNPPPPAFPPTQQPQPQQQQPPQYQQQPLQQQTSYGGGFGGNQFYAQPPPQQQQQQPPVGYPGQQYYGQQPSMSQQSPFAPPENNTYVAPWAMASQVPMTDQQRAFIYGQNQQTPPGQQPQQQQQQQQQQMQQQQQQQGAPQQWGGAPPSSLSPAQHAMLYGSPSSASPPPAMPSPAPFSPQAPLALPAPSPYYAPPPQQQPPPGGLSSGFASAPGSGPGAGAYRPSPPAQPLMKSTSESAPVSDLTSRFGALGGPASTGSNPWGGPSSSPAPEAPALGKSLPQPVSKPLTPQQLARNEDPLDSLFGDLLGNMKGSSAMKKTTPLGKSPPSASLPMGGPMRKTPSEGKS
eukprot:TRINITY_DN1058_c0_g1_i1.p1 TRINITY_DN1058_c0_g1~~TRINITY_DN1058_c0_g1_i1.p1  ORF type:complete len:882 (+),score=290.86 TRINITY_DN1058_c0_g1_i1:279-2924(+)